MSARKPVLLIAGAGPGISRSTALLFGAKHGYRVALVARTESKLASYTKELQQLGIVEAEYFVADLLEAEQVRSVLRRVHAKMGPVSVLLWCAYHHHFTDVLEASLEDINAELAISISSLVVATQELVKRHFPAVAAAGGRTALLVVGGGTSMTDMPGRPAAAVRYNIQVPALAAAAKRNFVASMAERLRPQGTVVGEVIVMGAVRDTPFAVNGGELLSPDDIAEMLWRFLSDPTCPRTLHITAPPPPLA